MQQKAFHLVTGWVTATVLLLVLNQKFKQEPFSGEGCILLKACIRQITNKHAIHHPSSPHKKQPAFSLILENNKLRGEIACISRFVSKL